MENPKDIGGVPTSVSNVLSVSGVGGINFWGGDLGFISGDVQESGGGARGFSHISDGSEYQVAEGSYLEKRGSGEGTQGRGNSDNGGIH